jgi:pimeloyl-ACP methyl ester carboxylesterase
MAFATLNGVTLHCRYRPGADVPVVCHNSLGTDFRIWDGVIAGLDPGAPLLCLDKRGHGLSDEGEITMALLAGDVAALMDTCVSAMP